MTTQSVSSLRLATALATVLLLAACGGEPSSGAAEDAAGASSSSSGLPKGRLQEGEQLANVKGPATGQSCIDCHGADGNQPLDPTYPKLGGQFADYLAHAMQHYRNGTRDHALMSQQAAHLTDQQIADLAAYFGSRPSELTDLRGAH